MTKTTSPQIGFRDAGLEAQLAMRTDVAAGGSLGLTAKEHLNRYMRLLAAELGSTNISANEWVALKVTTASRAFGYDMPVGLHYALWDSFQAGELPEGWKEMEVVAFMDKLQNLRPAQLWAIVDALERWRITGDVEQ